METIIFKAPVGTEARLRRLNRNISELLREQVEELIARAGKREALTIKPSHFAVPFLVQATPPQARNI